MIRLNTMPALRKLMRPQNSIAAGLHEVPPEAKSRQPARVEDALICKIVNREDGRKAVQGFVGPKHPLRQHRQQPGLPVVRMRDLIGAPPAEAPSSMPPAQETQNARGYRDNRGRPLPYR